MICITRKIIKQANKQKLDEIFCQPYRYCCIVISKQPIAVTPAYILSKAGK